MNVMKIKMFFIALQFLLFSVVTYSQFDPGFSCGTPDPLPDVAEFPLEGQICQPANSSASSSIWTS